jgi:hypothetical protein
MQSYFQQWLQGIALSTWYLTWFFFFFIKNFIFFIRVCLLGNVSGKQDSPVNQPVVVESDQFQEPSPISAALAMTLTPLYALSIGIDSVKSFLRLVSKDTRDLFAKMQTTEKNQQSQLAYQRKATPEERMQRQHTRAFVGFTIASAVLCFLSFDVRIKSRR